jgi:Lipopolysaccharide-assembly
MIRASSFCTDEKRICKRTFVCLWITALLVGCAPYQFGSQTLYRPGIRTVYVPIPRNDTFRHELGVQLAEALTREIETRTPYKVTGDPGADTALVCRVTHETKQVLTEASSDDPRALDLGISVQATWSDRIGNVLMQDAVIPAKGLAVGFGDSNRFVPEAGQTAGSASIETVQSLASQIVSQMESRW